MQTARSISLPVIVLLIAAVPTFAFAQFNELDSGPVPSASDASHRLLPADAQTLLRLREQTELLRALGLAPQNSNRLLNRNRPQSTTSREPVSPQLLEFLRQMAPQALPEQSPGQRDASQQRQQNGARSGPGLSGGTADDQQRLRKLDELLKQGDLSPSDLRQLQELMQSSNADVTNKPFEPAGKAVSDRPSGQAPSGGAIQQSRKRPATGGLESLPGNDPSTNSNTAGTDAEDFYADRQEILRRAFGIDPKSPSSVSSRAGSAASSSKGSDASRAGHVRRTTGLNSESDVDSLLKELRSDSVSGQRNALGNSIDDNSSLRSQAARDRLDAEQNHNRSGASSNVNADSPSAQQNVNGADGADDERSKRLSEISQSDQPAWQKLQRIAQLARSETNQRSSAWTDAADGQGFGLSNGLTRKLADVVQSAAQATAGKVSELRNGAGLSDRERSGETGSRTEPRSEIREWASSVNDWIASLPEGSAETPEPTASVIEGATEVESFGPVTWLIGLLIGGCAWWLLRRRFAEEEPEDGRIRKEGRLASSASERERLIHAFHELIHQSRCGSEEWWHHTRAVQQLTRQKPQLASAIQSLATIYEQARYSPDSEPSAEQLAAARSALKQCGKR